MSKQTLAQAIAQMNASLTEKLVGFSSKKVRETTEDIRTGIQKEYDYFFNMILDDVIGRTQTPGILAPFTSWKPLSPKWVKYKATNQHYVGLSNSATRGKALGRKRRGGNEIGMSRLQGGYAKPKGLVKVGAFSDYIRSLARQGTTERFFGPVSISYDFISPGDNFRVIVDQANGAVKTVKILQLKTASGRPSFMSFPKTLKMKSTIVAFPKLKGIAFNEKTVVDYILKRVDPANEKQWVKINSEYGIGRSKRPIRAVITPIIKFYIDKGLAEVVRAEIKARS